MRELKCRAKVKWNGNHFFAGDWVEGFYAYKESTDEHVILVERANMNRLGFNFIEVEVIPETVGQYTGLKDKNGKEIYEWDVVKFTRNVGPIYKPTIASDVGVIKWIEERASFRLCYNTQEQKIHSSYSSKYEVIGNAKEI